MTKEEFLIRLNEDEEYSPGWQAIDDAFEKLYPGQNPDHFGTIMTSRAIFGGDEYLDGFSIYSSPKAVYAFSNLINGYGCWLNKQDTQSKQN